MSQGRELSTASVALFKSEHLMTPASTKLMTKENVAEGNAKTQLTGTKARKSRNADRFTNGLRLPVVAMLSAAIADNGDEDQDSLSTRHCQKQ